MAEKASKKIRCISCLISPLILGGVLSAEAASANMPVLMPTHWDYRLVMLSIFIAILGSYVALDFAGRMKSSQTQNRKVWFVGGALMMGLAIWSMHFIGMLALDMQMPVTYNEALSTLSILAAATGAGLAFSILSRQTLGAVHIITGSLAMGMAIVTMHYIGMASMQMAARIHYDLPLFVLSVLIAIIASAGALWLAFNLERDGKRWLLQKVGSAVIMGIAIAGMHYTGMAAATYYHTGNITSALDSTPTVGLFKLSDLLIAASAVFGFSLLLLGSQTAAERQRALEIAQKSLEREKLAAEIIDQIRSEIDLNTILQQAVDRLGEFAQADRCVIWPYDPNSKQYTEAFEYRRSDGVVSVDQTRSPESPILPFSLSCTEAMAFSDVSKAQGLTEEDWQQISERGIKSLLHVPICYKEGVLGLLRVHWIREKQDWDEATVTTVKNIAAQVAVALHQAQILKSLQSSETRKSAILESALDAVVTIDAQCSIVEWNPGAEKIFGYQATDVLGKDLTELIIPESYRTAHRKGVAQYLKTGEGPVLGKLLELSAIRKDGSEFPAELYIVPIQSEGHILFTSTIRDITARREVETELRRSESRFKSLFNAGIIGIMITDMEDSILEANDAFLNMLGYSREELYSGQIKWADISPPGYEEADRIALEQFTKIGTFEPFQKQYFTKAGHRVDILLGGTRLEGPTTRGLLFALDISERVRAEQELRENEALLSDFFENATLGLHWVGPDGKILRANKAELEMLGYSAEEYIGHHIAEFHIDEPRITDILTRLTQNETLDSYEARLRAKDGSIKTVLINSNVYRKNGKFTHTRCFTRDITEFKKAQEALIESEERFRMMADSVPILIWMTDNQGAVQYVNKTWREFTGINMKEAIAHGWQESVHPDDFQSGMTIFQEAIRNRSAFKTECRLRRADGVYRWIHSNGIPRFEANGEFAGFIGSTYDITEIREAKEELERLVGERTIQLQSVNKELEAFSYSVSHDLRAPLRAIDGFSQAVIEDYANQLDETGKRYLTRIREGSQNMAQLIDDMLQLSRLNRAALNKEPIDLSQLARRIASDLQEQTPDRQVVFSIQEGLTAIGDKRLVESVLQNLLGNAWKFTSKHLIAHIEFGITNTEKKVYYVKDDGAGFDMAYAGKLFGAFQRLHDTGEFPGTGVGLASAQRIIHRHGGELWAEGEVEKGATFYFTFDEKGLNDAQCHSTG